jgi:TRAP-type C4-dicarboxylate transport system substrate-binding protein
VRDILEKGVADAVTFPWGSVPLFGIDKVTKYHMDVPLYVTTFAFVFNKDKYNEMSPRQKKAIDDHCNNEWAGKVSAPWAEFEHAGIAKRQATKSILSRRRRSRNGRRLRSRSSRNGPTM